MAKKQQRAERISATLATGTKVTAGSQTVIDKVKTRAESRVDQKSTSSKSSK